MAKKEVITLAVLSAFIVLFSGQVSALLGSGTYSDPYRVYNCTDLNRTRDYTYNSGAIGINFSIQNDIDCADTKNWDNGAGWMPIANLSSDAFVSIIRGNNHKIINLTINRPNTPDAFYTGLFRQLGAGLAVQNGVEVSNLDLVNVNITASGSDYVGALVGWAEGVLIDNVSITGTVTGGVGTAAVGGFVGGTSGSASRTVINNSYTNIEVITNSTYAAGFVGHMSGGTISHSYSTGNVSGAISTIKRGFMGNYFGGGWQCDSTYNDIYYSNIEWVNIDSCSTEVTTSQLKSPLFGNWDFNNVWIIGKNSGANGGYPYLRWQDFGTLYSSFSSGTDFNSAIDKNNVTNAVLANSQGSIIWNSGINVNGADFDSNTIIGTGFVSINSSKFDSSINSSANITLTIGGCDSYKLYYSPTYETTGAAIKSHNLECNSSSTPACTDIACDGNTLKFTVPHFDGYYGEGYSDMVPEFSTLTTIIALAIVLSGFFIMRNRKQ